MFKLPFQSILIVTYQLVHASKNKSLFNILIYINLDELHLNLEIGNLVMFGRQFFVDLKVFRIGFGAKYFCSRKHLTGCQTWKTIRRANKNSTEYRNSNTWPWHLPLTETHMTVRKNLRSNQKSRVMDKKLIELDEISPITYQIATTQSVLSSQNYQAHIQRDLSRIL